MSANRSRGVTKRSHLRNSSKTPVRDKSNGSTERTQVVKSLNMQKRKESVRKIFRENVILMKSIQKVKPTYNIRDLIKNHDESHVSKNPNLTKSETLWNCNQRLTATQRYELRPDLQET